MKKKIDENIEIPEGIEFNVDKNKVELKGEKGSFARKFVDRVVKLSKDQNSIKIECGVSSKREKARAFSYRAHIRNMIKGVQEGHNYELKICSSHFPMNVEVKDNQVVVKNFLGEKVPRVLKLKSDVEVKIDGSSVKISSISKEKAGQTAADIEQLCRITNRDKRIFQDGIYIIDKDGKKIN